MTSDEVLEALAREQGWDQDAKLSLALEFIDSLDVGIMERGESNVTITQMFEEWLTGRIPLAHQRAMAYVQYVQNNLDRIERGGWTPIGYPEFLGSEELENEMDERRKKLIDAYDSAMGTPEGAWDWLGYGDDHE